VGHILITIEDGTPTVHFEADTEIETRKLKDLFTKWLPLWDFQMKGAGDPNVVSSMVQSMGLEQFEKMMKGCEPNGEDIF